MSFDLFFYVGGATAPQSWDRLSAWADEQRHFHRRVAAGGGFELFYENPATGVYFSIIQADPLPPNAATQHLTPASLAFNLNFMRARFFAIEAAEIVADLATRLELLVYDPQRGEVGRPTAAQLVDSWCRGNHAGVLAMRAMGQALPFMAAQNADAFWRYCFDLARVKKTLGKDVFVPELVAVRRGDVALRLAILLKPTQYVMPPADLFYIDRNGALLAVRADHVHAALGSLCKPARELPGVSLITESVLFRAGVMDAWDRFYETVPVECPVNQLERLKADGFVDL